MTTEPDERAKAAMRLLRKSQTAIERAIQRLIHRNALDLDADEAIAALTKLRDADYAEPGGE
jgi:hypothetical protein